MLTMEGAKTSEAYAQIWGSLEGRHSSCKVGIQVVGYAFKLYGIHSSFRLGIQFVGYAFKL